jgi:hypothetical protein
VTAGQRSVLDSTATSGAGHPQDDSAAAAAAATAATVLTAPAVALLRRRSRLSGLLVGGRGPSSGSGGVVDVVDVVDSLLGADSASDAGVGVGVGLGKDEGVSGNEGEGEGGVLQEGTPGVVVPAGSSSSRVSQLVQILRGGCGEGLLLGDTTASDSSSTLEAAGGAAEALVAESLAEADAGNTRMQHRLSGMDASAGHHVTWALQPEVEQQQQQQQGDVDDAGSAHVWHPRGRSTTLDVLGEVAGRLQSAAHALSQAEGADGEQGGWEAAAAQLRGVGHVPASQQQ